MPNEPQWLPIEAVIEYNRLEVAATGEHHFVRDLGLLESALTRLQNAFAMARKTLSCLRLNGYDLAIEDTAAWADPVISLVEHRSTEEDFARAIRPSVVLRS